MCWGYRLSAWRTVCLLVSRIILFSALIGRHVCFFFFSSRRRHTRSDRDWSSDVCSSDRSEEHTSELQSQAEDGIRDLIVTGVQTCALPIDRKSTRLNSSHDQISYAVFCL